jgi:hypothetical protein
MEFTGHSHDKLQMAAVEVCAGWLCNVLKSQHGGTD